ncbi:hypothetical protein GTR00_22410 [Kineococcus sp. T90]|nr:hypothetical protein [Kineococcus indalonis]
MEHESRASGGGTAPLTVPLTAGSTLSGPLTALPGADGRVVLQDADGDRYVLVPESSWSALLDGAREGRPGVSLTAREREVLRMVADGCAGSVIAERLGLAPNTVAQHLASVRRKYGVRSSATAAAAARRQGLLD